MGACACSLRQQEVDRQESEFEVNLVCKKLTDRRTKRRRRRRGEKRKRKRRNKEEKGEDDRGGEKGGRGGRPENLKED